MPEPVKVATRGDIPPGGKLLVEIDGRPIAVFRVGDAFHAIDDVCTHDGGPLAEGELHGCEIRCPRHGARFDVRDGRALCMPAIEPVPAHRVELRGDDVLVHVED
jgi:3-phenylpropionate/trans-cinnamate dioxygenase ferredoxin subunit